jgi:hypothetical protein
MRRHLPSGETTDQFSAKQIVSKQGHSEHSVALPPTQCPGGNPNETKNKTDCADLLEEFH